ncbi:MAG: hypothetical protein IJK89_13625 [Clostridia bacterium]|nr:hypothetical protein [Clostridia bacterium]
MTTLFLTLLNMSVTAGVTALAVMLARAAFKKLPKWLTCLLWVPVGLRLALPFTWESALSLIPRASTVRETVGQFTETAGTASPAPVAGSTEYFAVSNFIPPTPVSVPAAKPFDWLSLFTAIWLAGAAAMLCYLIVSALLLKRRVGACVETEPGVFVADGLASPFVLGVFRPKIYLPPSLDAAQREMILAHERAHLKRRDHLIKPLAFLLLSVYWFNPVLWVAYALLCRDIELACDERVIRDMDREDRAFYSRTLLDCGRQRKSIAACPVAFGEVGVKERVKNVLNYKKPAFWIILIAVIAGIALAVCFLTDPKTEKPKDAYRATLTDGVDDESLDARIFAAMQAQSSSKYLEGECYTEAHYVFDTEEKDEKTVVYALVRECWFGFVNGYFTEVSGGQRPMVFTFDGDSCEIDEAEDGGRYGESVETLFPTQYADEILKHGDRYNDALWNDLTEQAKAYLKSIRRSGAVVCKTSEAGLSTLSDHGVSVEVSNILINMPLLSDYPFYGTQEKIEDGVRYVYSTAYDAQTGQITYLKYIYGEDPDAPKQKIIIDAATGEILFNYSAPVGPVEKGKDIQIDVDWIDAAKIDERVCDVDGDGTEDRCVMSYGSTSGLFTFYLTVIPTGADAPKYQSIFLTDWSDLSFAEPKKDMDLYVRARNPLDLTDEKLYRVLIENGELVLRGDGDDMPHWGGEAQTLRVQALQKQFPGLFTLNAKKGLDVYVWPWADGYCGWVTEHQKDHTDEQMVELLLGQDGAILAGRNMLTTEDLKAILSFYDLPAEKVTVVPFQNPVSSYLWAQDGKIIDGSVTVEDLREMLGL